MRLSKFVSVVCIFFVLSNIISCICAKEFLNSTDYDLICLIIKHLNSNVLFIVFLIYFINFFFIVYLAYFFGDRLANELIEKSN